MLNQEIKTQIIEEIKSDVKAAMMIALLIPLICKGEEETAAEMFNKESEKFANQIFKKIDIVYSTANNVNNITKAA